ncbi:FAD-binding protein [Aliigemmobacter aestuarii]|uniref:FAD-binding protein n=1 Tax=Aliigemmobacter aestuarii TaxID=1445661 RepID=A0A4V3V0S5_9RHOB|nr:FAD-binding protein [Gemmobacter aestuarii]THD85142.1 FAD-binding protein [Gemmobacter aestuarii]
MRPADEDELAEVIRVATTHFSVQGGGTRGLEGVAAGAVLETGGIAGITLYEPGALTLVARAGTPLAEIETALAAEGQRLPFEVPDFRAMLGRQGESTIGGVMAANASGPRRVQAGAARDSLIGVRFVDGRGDVIRNGGRVMKNVTGYDLVKLMAGSRGSLGILTEVSMKVLPAPEAQATLSLAGLDDARAVAAMSAALGSPFEVSGAAHWPGRGTFLRIEGFTASVAYRAERLAALLAGFGRAERIEGAGPWPEIRDAAPFAGRAGDVWRLSVKPSDAPGLIARAGAEAHLMDWGGGLVWILTAPGADLRTRLGGFSGHATRVRATDPADGIPALHPEPPAVAALTAGLKNRFDPRGLFNPAHAGAF